MFYMLSKTSWTFCNFINFLHVLWLLRCAFYTMLFIDVYPCVYPIFKWFQSAKFYICAYTHTHFSLLVNWLCFTVRMPVYSILISIQFISVTQSCPTLQPHGLQHSTLFCPSPTPRACSNSCPSSWWCHSAISFSVVPPLLLLLSILPSIRVFPVSQFFALGGQSIGVSASTTVLPMNIQDWFPLGWIGWISLQSKGLSRVFSNTTVQKYQCFSAQVSFWSNTNIHTWLQEKP